MQGVQGRARPGGARAGPEGQAVVEGLEGRGEELWLASGDLEDKDRGGRRGGQLTSGRKVQPRKVRMEEDMDSGRACCVSVMTRVGELRRVS